MNRVEYAGLAGGIDHTTGAVFEAELGSPPFASPKLSTVLAVPVEDLLLAVRSHARSTGLTPPAGHFGRVPLQSGAAFGRAPLRRLWSPTVLPSAWAEVPEVLTGLSSLACGAVPCHRAGRDHLQCGHKASSASWPYVTYARCDAMPLRRVWSLTVLPSAWAKSASGTSRPCVTYLRGNARPSCWAWSLTVLP